jgi:hypothetical protein
MWPMVSMVNKKGITLRHHSLHGLLYPELPLIWAAVESLRGTCLRRFATRTDGGIDPVFPESREALGPAAGTSTSSRNTICTVRHAVSPHTERKLPVIAHSVRTSINSLCRIIGTVVLQTRCGRVARSKWQGIPDRTRQYFRIARTKLL